MSDVSGGGSDAGRSGTNRRIHITLEDGPGRGRVVDLAYLFSHIEFPWTGERDQEQGITSAHMAVYEVGEIRRDADGPMRGTARVVRACRHSDCPVNHLG